MMPPDFAATPVELAYDVLSCIFVLGALVLAYAAGMGRR